MDDLVYIINYSLDMLNNTEITFSPFHFTLGQYIISLFALSIVVYSIRKLYL
jgi:hypothetical protein